MKYWILKCWHRVLGWVGDWFRDGPCLHRIHLFNPVLHIIYMKSQKLLSWYCCGGAFQSFQWEVIALTHHPNWIAFYKASNVWRPSVLLTFVGEAIWEFPCRSSGFSSFFLFVSLPVFIKLVKFLLQCCQACIILCSSHHCALQLPGNCVWRRHAERQRAPSESPCSEHIIKATHKV